MAALGKDFFPKDCVYAFDIKHMGHGINFPSLFWYARNIPYIL